MVINETQTHRTLKIKIYYKNLPCVDIVKTCNKLSLAIYKNYFVNLDNHAYKSFYKQFVNFFF